MSTFVIDLADGAGSLERLLNKCRRKGHIPRSFAVGPSVDGVQRVLVDFHEPAATPQRIAADLAKVYDVRAIEHRADPHLAAALDAALATATP